MSIEHSQILACFLHHFITLFSRKSGPGPLGPVRKSLVVRSGPEGLQFARSVGKLIPTYTTFQNIEQNVEKG